MYRNRLAEEPVRIFHVTDCLAMASWYARIGFELIGEHCFEPGFPLYAFLRQGNVHLHLSEHTGDAPYHPVAYFYVGDVDTIAIEFGAEVQNQPWARENPAD